MWNGIWKLTAMVGVIGVGLFAAYQAHVGMNAPVKVASEEPEQEEPQYQADTPARKFRELPEFSLEQSKPNANVDTETVDVPVRKSTAKRKPPVDDDESMEESDAKLNAAIKMVSASRSSGKTPKVVTATQRSGVDFRDNTESADSKSAQENSDQEQSLEDVPKSTKSKQKPRQLASADTGRVSWTGEDKVATEPVQEQEEPLEGSANEPATEVKEWPAEGTESASTEEASLTEEAVVEEPVEMPAEQSETTEPPIIEPELAPAVKQEIKNEFDSEPPPFTSNRAKNRSGTKSEEPSAAKPSIKKVPAKSAIQATSQSTEEESTFGKEPEPLAVEPEPAPISEPPSFDTLPNDPPARLPEPTEPAADRRRLPKNIPASDNVISDQQDDRAAKKRVQPNKRIDSRVIPIDDRDLIGDGVVGDASSKGVQQPRLVIEKVAQQQAVLDQPFVYSIVVKNTGNVDAHNVTIEDRIPKGTELQGTSPQAELEGKKLVWKLQALKPNEEKRISVKVIPRQEGPVGSVARVYFATEVTAEVVVAAPQLDFIAKVPQEVRLGQRFEMVFTLKNVGKVDATNVVVRDVLPEELKNETGADIECPVGKLAPGESRELVLPVMATRPGRVTNRAYLEADSGIRKSHDNNIDVIGEVLVLTRSGQNRLYVERPAVFTNSIRNDGNQRADSVRLAEVVPAGMEFDSASDGGRYDPNLKQVVWTLGPLAPGNDKQVSVKYVPKETGTHSSKITAAGTGGTSAAVDSSVEVVGKPELVMETLSATGVVTLGEKITSKFQLNNTGTAPANNVQLRIKLPPELRLISVKGTSFRQRDDMVVFDPISELNPKSKASYELILEPVEEAEAQITLEISADHLSRPGRRIETIQIAADALK